MRTMRLLIVFAFSWLALSAAAVCAERGEEIRLWPNGAPGSEGITAAEVSKPSVAPNNGKLPGNFTVTHYPSIYVFLPPKGKATGAAMVVAPGGGHTQLVMEKEGWEMADWLNDHGIEVDCEDPKQRDAFMKAWMAPGLKKIAGDRRILLERACGSTWRRSTSTRKTPSTRCWLRSSKPSSGSTGRM